MSATKTILVTGGAGFIGSHTSVELINNGFTPVVVDDYRNSDRRNIEGVNSITNTEVIVREIDICDLDKLKEVFQEFQFDGIIHFAAYKAVGESVEKPLDYYRNNIVGLVNCLQLAEEFYIRNIVFSSSCTVYGEPEGIKTVTEASPVQPANSPYGNTKQIGEEIIRDLILSGANMKIINLRYFNPVGAHKSSIIGELPIGTPNNLFPYVMQTGIGKLEELSVFGNDYDTKDGTCIRDYIHVCDVAEAHVKALDWLMAQEGRFSEDINIGTGKGTSVLEVINMFEEVAQLKLNWKFAARRPGDVEEIYANVEKSISLLNWRATRTVMDAVQDAWNWEKKLNND